MLQSTKIKILGIVGTFAIISTAYTLHANVFYKELYPALSKKKTPLLTNESQQVIVNKNAQQYIEKVIEANTSKDIVKIDDIVETNCSVAKINEISEEIQDIEENKTVLSSNRIEPMSELERLLKENRYLYLDSSNQITTKSKQALDKLKSLVSELDDNVYIEVEGYSASKNSAFIAKKDSEKIALLVSNYLKSLNIDKEIVVTAYGDSYPIIEDIKDIRNSRVEVKIRRR